VFNIQGYPHRDETSETTVQNVYCLIPYTEAQLGLLLGGGGNILFCKGQGGLRGTPPPLFENFSKTKVFFKGLKSKKGNFKLLHADLAVFNSNRFFGLVFLQNLYFQQL